MLIFHQQYNILMNKKIFLNFFYDHIAFVITYFITFSISTTFTYSYYFSDFEENEYLRYIEFYS